MLAERLTSNIARTVAWTQAVSRTVASTNKIGRGFSLFLAVLVCALGIYSYTRAGEGARVYAATTNTMNFQARLLATSGAITPDSTYSVQFKLYNVATGGTAEWTETQSVVVKSGYLSVSLGSVTAFPPTIDWSQEHWLTMNVNGDGEMSPRLKLTAVPYAFKSGQADKLASSNGALGGDGFAQLNPVTAQTITSALAGLRINQTGAGGLLQLQGDGIDAFTVSKTGNGFLSGTLGIGGSAITGNGALTLRSGGTGDLALDSASNKLVISGTDTSLERIGTGAFGINLSDTGLTQLTLGNSGTGVANLNLLDGAFQTAGITRVGNNGALSNVTGSNLDGVSFDANTITSGTLGITRGGTGVNTFTSNGVLFGNGTNGLQATLAGTAGQLLLAGIGGVPAFTTISGDASLSSSGVLTIGGNTVTLGTDTTGNYINTITVGGGLVISGVGVEDATAALGLDVTTTGTTAVTATNSGLEATATGLRLIGGCTNGQLLKWNGTTWACGADNQGLSDSRLKQNVMVKGSVLDAIKNVRVVDYDFKCLDAGLASLRLNCKTHTGIISQELAAIFPDLVIQNADGYFEVNFGALNFYTLKAVTELANIIDASGNAKLGNVSTGGTLRLTSTGGLQNITGLGVISGGATIAGTTSINGAFTSSGGSINLNAGGLLTNTNINTGASTGTVTIGGGLSGLVISSTGLDVSATGAVSGVTTLDASGDISIDGIGAFTRNGAAGLTSVCANNNYLSNIVVSGGIITGSNGCRSTGLSDARVKENVVAVGSVLDQLRQVNTVNFDFKCDDPAFTTNNLSCDTDRQTGVIAQELATVFPELVYQDDSGLFRVRYDALNIYTLKAVTELADKVDGQATSAPAQSNSNSLVLNANQTDNLLTLTKDGNGVFTIFNNGAMELMLDSNRALAVKDAGGSDIFTVDSLNGNVRIGSGKAAKTIVFTLDTKTTAGDPNGTNGSMYYNDSSARFRCFQDNRWQDCLPAANASYTITDRVEAWAHPAAQTELPNQPRVWIDLTNAREYRLNLQVNTAGAADATCTVQYANGDNGEWQAVSSDERADQSISQTGTLRSAWITVDPAARNEVLIRMVCEGGNGDSAIIAESPQISGISMQLR